VNELANKTILVTRPLPQAQSLLDAITACSGQAIHLPTMEIVAFDSVDAEKYPPIKRLILDIDQVEIAICISVTSAELALAWLEQYWPQLPTGIRWVAVGSSTAAVLQNAGLDVVFPEQLMDSGELLKLELLQQVSNKKIVLFKGEGGRDLIEKTLQQRGARVTPCELYQRRPMLTNAETLVRLLHENTLSAMTGHSGEMIESSVALLGNDKVAKANLFSVPLVIPGERVAQRARELGFNTVVVAENATTEIMIKTLCEWNRS
jgi:uroporphyrinogen-III synthase